MQVTMKVLSRHGHTATVGDTDLIESTDEVVCWEQFEKMFAHYVESKRYHAFAKPEGRPISSPSEVEEGEYVLMVPQIAGG